MEMCNLQGYMKTADQAVERRLRYVIRVWCGCSR